MAGLNIDLSGIKPLLSSLGLGEAPRKVAPPVNQLPPPAMPPPPTPAAAGFSEWSGDPKNQEKVLSSFTPAGTPMPLSSPNPQQNGPMAFLNPPQRQYASLNPPQLSAAPDSTTPQATTPAARTNPVRAASGLFGKLEAAGGIPSRPNNQPP